MYVYYCIPQFFRGYILIQRLDQNRYTFVPSSQIIYTIFLFIICFIQLLVKKLSKLILIIIPFIIVLLKYKIFYNKLLISMKRPRMRYGRCNYCKHYHCITSIKAIDLIVNRFDDLRSQELFLTKKNLNKIQQMQESFPSYEKITCSEKADTFVNSSRKKLIHSNHKTSTNQTYEKEKQHQQSCRQLAQNFINVVNMEASKSEYKKRKNYNELKKITLFNSNKKNLTERINSTSIRDMRDNSARNNNKNTSFSNSQSRKLLNNNSKITENIGVYSSNSNSITLNKIQQNNDRNTNSSTRKIIVQDFLKKTEQKFTYYSIKTKSKETPLLANNTGNAEISQDSLLEKTGKNSRIFLGQQDTYCENYHCNNKQARHHHTKYCSYNDNRCFGINFCDSNQRNRESFGQILLK